MELGKVLELCDKELQTLSNLLDMYRSENADLHERVRELTKQVEELKGEASKVELHR